MIKTLLIGLGNIGINYDNNNKDFIQTHANALNKHPYFELISGIDTLQKQRSLFQEIYKKKAYKDIKTFKNISNVDLIIVATPTDTHLSVIEESIFILKPKMILCEKPLSYNYQDAKKIIDLCEKQNVQLFVNFMRRCDPGVIEIKNKLDDNSFRTPIKGYCWYSKGLLNSGSHFINLLEFWLGDHKEIQIINKGRFYDNFDPEPEFLIQFERGSIIFRSAWEEYFSFYNIQLISPSGVINYEVGGEIISFFDVINDKSFPGYRVVNNKRNEIQSNMKIYQYNVLDQIYKSFIGKKNTTICKGSEALKTQKILYLITKDLLK